MLGPPRGVRLARAKYSQWVSERERLEEMRPQGASEVWQRVIINRLGGASCLTEDWESTLRNREGRGLT